MHGCQVVQIGQERNVEDLGGDIILIRLGPLINLLHDIGLLKLAQLVQDGIPPREDILQHSLNYMIVELVDLYFPLA